jgi:dipeptidyl aminopeptidase/acylaminoacyl peptidase
MRHQRLLSILSVLVLAAGGGAAQHKTIQPTENLVVDGVPPIPASLADDVRRYTEARPANVADRHPTRREILISTRFGNTAQVHRVKPPGGDRTQLAFFNEPIRGATFEPAEGRYFVFGKDVGGDELAQLYRYDVADGRVTLLTDGGRSQNGGVVWSSKGDRLAYGSTRRNGADRDLCVMNPADSKTDKPVMQVTGGGWQALDWSRDDTRLLVIEFASIAKSTLWLVDAGSGQKTALTNPSEDVSYGAGKFAADGRGVYVTTDKDSEFQRLGYIDLATGQLTPLVSKLRWDVEDFDLSLDGKTIAFATNEAGVSKVYLFDTATGRARRSPALRPACSAGWPGIATVAS